MENDKNNVLVLLQDRLNQWLVEIIRLVPNIIVCFIILILFAIFSRFLRKIIGEIIEKFFPSLKSLHNVINRIIGAFFWFVCVILILDLLNLNHFVTHILASAGIAGIIAGFAFKDVASNAFAGILIRLQKPYVIGDWIQMGETIGIVRNIGLVGTWVETHIGHMFYVPNQMIFNTTFLNYSTYGKMKMIITVGVSYGDDLDYVQKVGLELIDTLPMALPNEPKEVFFTDIGSSTYNLEIRFWIKYNDRPDLLNAQSEAVKAIKKHFDAANICVAYNVTTLDFGVKGGVNIFDKDISIKKKSENKDSSLKTTDINTVDANIMNESKD